MNRLNSLFRLSIIPVFSGVLLISNNSCSKLNDIQNSVNDIKSQNDSLEAQLRNLQTTVAYLETLSLQNRDSLIVIDNKIDSLLSLIGQINQQLLSNTGDISQIQQELLTLTQEYQALLTLINQMIACCPGCSIDINNDLVAYYPFTGNPGDSSGYGNNAFVYGPTLTSDRFGRANSAYNFNGSNYIAAPSQGWINFPTSSFSLNAWINMNAIQPNSYNGVLTKGNNGHFIYQLGVDSSTSAGEFGGQNYLMDFTHLRATQPMAPNNWYNLSMIIDRDSNQVRLYVNGSLSQTYANGAIATEDISSPDSLRIGVERDQLFHFNGKIDDIRIYKRALNNAEIAYLAAH
jgi:hypothetical protein